MSNTSDFLEKKTKGGFFALLRRIFFRTFFEGLSAVSQDIEQADQRAGEIERAVCGIQEQIDILREQVQTIDTGVISRLDVLEELEGTLRNELIASLRNDLETISVNLRNNNAAIEKLSADSEFAKLKLNVIEKGMKNNRIRQTSAPVQTESAQAAPAVQTAPESDDSEYEKIDYFDFENHFRGSIESIKKAQEIYLEYFCNKKNVVDIGCGRGEFLALMKESNVNARGVDIYEPYVDYCRMKGLDAVCGDGVEYLSGQDGVDGIFVGQVVEHLKTGEIIRLCNTAYEKLSAGGCIVIETPNPTSLAIYTNAFYIDPSHIKPVHPLTMKYFLEKAGFKDIKVIYTEHSRPPYAIPELDVEGAEEFNNAMKNVSDLLYGSQDYAVIAIK